jgi:type I restriction-modification system DNA methylase subunit
MPYAPEMGCDGTAIWHRLLALNTAATRRRNARVSAVAQKPGGMLSVADEYLSEHNPDARLAMYGQELNDLSYAICKADMLIRGQDPQ